VQGVTARAGARAVALAGKPAAEVAVEAAEQVASVADAVSYAAATALLVTPAWKNKETVEEITAERLEELSAENFCRTKKHVSVGGVISLARRNMSFLRSLDHSLQVQEVPYVWIEMW
jgi:hypothetical protein